MDELIEEVEEIRGNVVCKKSREVYSYGIVKFVLWLHSNLSGVVATPLRVLLDGVTGVDESLVLKEKSCRVKQFMQEDLNRPPVELLQITPEHFECFLLSLRKKDGKKPGKPVYSSMRSSLFHLYRTYNVKIPGEFNGELKTFFKGLKRSVVQRQQDEGESLAEGKVGFTFSLYQKICKVMREQPKKRFVFAHSFLVVSWNLMCRAGNSSSIRYGHLEWDEDALAIWFCHMKNDQEGERQRDPRHVYANPTEPDICPILSLAMYFTVFGFNAKAELFSGKNQYDRYSRILRKSMEIPLVAREFEITGREPADFGSHSARKGSSTYVSGCCTGGPSSASVSLRGGWNLPGVQDTYIRYEAAGDRVVGRFVSGLPYETPEFSILPPFFEDVDATVWSAVSVVFPNVPDDLQKVCCYLLASLVHHHDHLVQTLDENHILFNSPLFRTSELVRTLKPKVVCRCWRPGDVVRASGVPPHLGVIVNMNRRLDTVDTNISQLHDQISSVDSKLDTFVPNILHDGLSTPGPGALPASRGAINVMVAEAVAAALHSTGVTQMMRTIHANSASIVQVVQQQAEISTTTSNSATYISDERTRSNHSAVQETHEGLEADERVAEADCELTSSASQALNWWQQRTIVGFTFPRVPLIVAWELWWFGCPSKNWPPYRSLVPTDLPNKNTRKRLSNFRFVMTKIESIARQNNTYDCNPSLHQARQMLVGAMDSLPIGDQTQRNYTRRKEHLQWSTVVNLLRRHNRSQR